MKHVCHTTTSPLSPRIEMSATLICMHFTNVIPELAIKFPVLLNAALAASARHLSRFDGIFTLVAEKYHDYSTCTHGSQPFSSASLSSSQQP